MSEKAGEQKELKAETGESAEVSEARSTWPIKRESYRMQETIGSGATSIVHKAFCEAKNRSVAIKRIDLERCLYSMDELQKEIHAMSICNHENVATFYTAFVSKSELWIVMRLFEYGSVLDLINHMLESKAVVRYEGVLEEAAIATILRDVCRGLLYFHSNDQIHRDVKSGNILIGIDGSVQLADFGVSSAIRDYDDRIGSKYRKTFVGTPCWMAPEVMDQNTGYNYKVDIWSLGITALEMATGSAPYAKYPAMKVLMLTLQNDPPTLETCADGKSEAFKKYSKNFRKMVGECLKKASELRPDTKTLLKHKFFKAAKNKDYLSEYIKRYGILAQNKHKSSKKQNNHHQQNNHQQQQQEGSGRMVRSLTGEWIFPDEEKNQVQQQQQNELSNTSGSNTKINYIVKESDKNCAVVTDNNNNNDNKVEKPHQVFNIIFRIRNKKKELNEISFTFDTHVDTYNGIAEELVNADLINGQSRVLVAANLEKLITMPDCPKIVFQLKNVLAQNEAVDEENLIGCAQLMFASKSSV